MRSSFRLVVPIVAALFATPALAQEERFDGGEWGEVAVTEDVTLRARGEQVVRPGADGSQGTTYFVSYVKLGPADKQYGARMICYAGVVKNRATAAELDLQARYATFAKGREERGYTTDRLVEDNKGGLRALHAVGQRDDPHRHFVMSLILALKGDTAVSVTRSCTFEHTAVDIPPTDFLAYVQSNTEVRFSFPTASNGTAQ